MNITTQRFLIAATLAATCLHGAPAAADETNPAPQETTTLEALSDHAAEAWNRSRGRMLEILDLEDEKQNVPKSAWVRRDQHDVDEDINALLQEVLDALRLSALTDYRGEYAALDARIEKKRVETRKLREDRMTADDEKSALGFFKLTRDGYTQRIKSTEKEIGALEEQKSDLVDKLRNEYARMGVTLSREQVRFYLASVSGRDIMALSAVFDNMRALNDQLEALVKQSPGDPEAARRYYGIHVVLIKAVVMAHEVTLDNIENRYLTRISELEKRNAEVRGETKKLMRDASSEQNAILKATRQAQDTTDATLKVYRRHLVNVQQRIQKGLTALQSRYEVAHNAYETITISSALAAEMQTAIEDLATLQGLHLPDLIPFDNDAIAQRFGEITAALEAE